jgi:hypothetical protein
MGEATQKTPFRTKPQPTSPIMLVLVLALLLVFPSFPSATLKDR